MPRSRADRLFGAACLKVTLERSSGKKATGEIYEGALEDLQLTDDEVHHYLLEHRSTVEAALDARKSRPDNGAPSKT